MEVNYTYKARCVSVYDVDTIMADIDLGCTVWIGNEPLRLAGINAPEVRGPSRPEGIKARDWLRERILGKSIIIQTQRDMKGKYGRFIATIWEPAGGLSINDQLVQAGHAVKVQY